ncbi:transporter [Microbulbifer bruguierae]|uniref:Transporter n=1 Tax=Microbulbifer bruguierae TaxID=3029061 RepID=A0ABY8NHW0_9GAMM|nr:transporter [Microbulbifer bruguierae]WGL18509.1 transporter [Microbulbifer bruguierae]
MTWTHHHRNARHSLALALSLCAALLLLPTPSRATEGGIGYYVPGTMATLIDRAPIQTGWVFKPQYMHYSGDFSATAETPIAGVVALGVDVEIDAVAPGLLYTFEKSVLGAKYTVGAFPSWVDVTVKGAIESDLGNFSRRDSASGLGDTTLIPALMAWQEGCWQYNFMFAIHAPTGDYEVGRLANEGLNYWAVDPVVGVAYTNQAAGFNASVFTGVMFNDENSDTDYRSGRTFHLDASVQQMIKAGSGFITLGVNAFWGQQFSPDRNPGRFVDEFKMRSGGIGPVIGYMLPMGTDNILLELSWLPQTDTRNTTEGEYLWLKFVYQWQ